jgi:DNA (cytosine-5)-methyltransferase 1
LKIVSLFSGCGGLDLGFAKAGFSIIYANDNDKTVWETYEKNHGLTVDKRSLFEIKSSEVPAADGIIGGPPCQSWSLAGKMRGTKDERGQLFHEYVRVLRDKRPLFFLAENVPGIVSKTHIKEFEMLLHKLSALGYNISFKIVDARNYGIPQERKRVIIVGYKNTLGLHFDFPPESHSRYGEFTLEGKQRRKWVTLREAIGDLPIPPPALAKNKTNGNTGSPNHEYMIGTFSSIYMSRNRRKHWDQQSFTIQAGGRHAPLHPSSSEMIKLEQDSWKFKDATNQRRMSARECARIQTFPDDFTFYYQNVADAYKMIGNAVPVALAEVLAKKIRADLYSIKKRDAPIKVSGVSETKMVPEKACKSSVSF